MICLNVFFCLQHIVKASTDGTVEEILCSVGDNVTKNKLLVKLAETKI